MYAKMSKIHTKTGNTCLICCDDVQNNCIIIHKTRRQTHSLCNECGTTYLSNLIDQTINNLRKNIRNKASIIKCPGSYHGAHRNHCQKETDIGAISIPESSPLYTDIFRILYLSKHENTYMCPNKECGELVETNPYSSPRTECPSCKYVWCRNCQRYPFHDGMGCLEAELLEDTTNSGRYLREMVKQGNIKYCPVCRNLTEKLKHDDGSFQGCNKIWCGCCNTKWCWLCGEKNIDYDHYNFSSGKRCSGKLWEGSNC